METSPLEEILNDNLMTIDNNTILLLDEKKSRLHEIRQKKMEGVMLRSRCRYEDMGEKPSKYFLNLESRNFTSKVISKLVNENGEEYTETQDILNYQKLYYKNLYTESLNFDDISLSEKIGENPKNCLIQIP